jgi:predicted PurR-regulated permease PerM
MKFEGITLPIYARVTFIILGFLAFFTILYIARAIFIPLLFSLIFAFVLYPVVSLLTRAGLNRVVAIMLSIFFGLLIVAAISGFLIFQISHFIESWPELVEKFSLISNNFTSRLSEVFAINPNSVEKWIKSAWIGFLESNSALIGTTLSTFGGILMAGILVPVYIFLLLYYQLLLREFIKKLFIGSNQIRVEHVITQTQSVIQTYLVGLIIETAIIAVLEISTLAILGIKYAVLLGIIGALLNIIPYIGGIVAVVLPMFVAIVTKSSGMYAISILLIYYAIQLIDNNIILPRLVASKVRINALFSIIAVIAGNALWGIPGMILSIPLLVVLKLLFDNIESLQAWGYLLGDTVPIHAVKLKPVFRIIKKPDI